MKDTKEKVILPAWAVGPMEDAGVSGEATTSGLLNGSVWFAEQADGRMAIRVTEGGDVSLHMWELPLPDAFRLAARLAAALEGKEALEAVTAERDRLAKALEQAVDHSSIRIEKYGLDGMQTERICAVLHFSDHNNVAHYPELAAYLREREVGA